MTKHTLLTRAAAAAALSATITVPAVLGLTAGTANAKPRNINCIVIGQVIDDHIALAAVAYDQGDDAAAQDHLKTARLAQSNYSRHCMG